MRHRFSTSLLLFPLFFLAACQPVSTEEMPRTVAVTGEGEISVPPEIATVHLSVQARDTELARAQAKAGDVVNAVLKLADALEISREQVQSTQLSVHPEFDWHDGRQAFRGYLVQRDVRVEIEDLAKLGPLLERAMAAGVNNVSPPELGVKDPRRLYRDVLQRAAADAQANAEALAQTLEATLGEVQRVNAVDGGGQPPVPMMRMAQAESDAAQDYTAGRITVRARVQAEFELR